MEFAAWLQAELNKRDWDQAELSRRSEITKAQISRVLMGERSAGVDFCIAVARALGVPREEVFRARGFLHKDAQKIFPPDADPRVEAMWQAVNTLPATQRDAIVEAWGATLKAAGVNYTTYSEPSERQGSNVVDLTLFPEEDRNLIGQLEPVFQEYLAVLLKQGREQYQSALDYSRSKADAEIQRRRQPQRHH